MVAAMKSWLGENWFFLAAIVAAIILAVAIAPYVGNI